MTQLDGNSVPPDSYMGFTQWYGLNLSLAHLVMCAMDLLVGSTTSLFTSRSAYVMNRFLTLIYVMMYVMSCFLINVCHKMTKHSTI